MTKKPEPTEAELKADWRQAAIDFEGCEVPRAAWPLAEAIVAEEPDAFTFGPARGPGGDWRRLEPIETD